MKVQEAIAILSDLNPEAELLIGYSCCGPVPIGEVLGAYEEKSDADGWRFMAELSGMKDEKAVLFEEDAG